MEGGKNRLFRKQKEREKSRTATWGKHHSRGDGSQRPSARDDKGRDRRKSRRTKDERKADKRRR